MKDFSLFLVIKMKFSQERRLGRRLILLVLAISSLMIIKTATVHAQNTVVVFSENFDNPAFEIPLSPYYSTGWFCASPLNTLQPESGKGNILKVNFPAGTVGAQSGLGNFRIPLDSAYKELYLSWDYFVPSDFDYGWGDGKGGGKFFGGFAGGSMTAIPNNDATDVDGWASIFMFQDGYYSTYNYFKGTSYTTDGWPNGDRIANIVKGQWNRITIRLKINEGELSDGICEVFDNDVLVFQQTNAKIVNAAHPEYLIEHIYMNSFFGGNGLDYISPIDQYMEFDNLIAFYYPPGSSEYRSGASEKGRILQIPQATSYHPLPPNKFTPAAYTDASGTINSHCAFYQPVDHPGNFESSTIEVSGATYLNLDLTRFDFDIGQSAPSSKQTLRIYQGTGPNKVLMQTFQNGVFTSPGIIHITGNAATIEWQAGQGMHGGFSLNYTSDGTGTGNNISCGDFNARQEGIVIVVPPVTDAPSSLIMKSVDHTSATIQWTDNSNNESFFEIERSGPIGDLRQTVRVSANTTEFTDTTLEVNSTYIYWVRAYSTTNAYSAYSNLIQVTTPNTIQVDSIAAPSSLTLNKLDKNSVTIQWIDNSNNESLFEVERSGPNGNLRHTFVVLANTTVFTDTALEVNSSYSYWVRGFSITFGYSNYTNPIQVTTPPDEVLPVVLPNAPTMLLGKEFTNESITIRWNDNSTDEKGFVISRSLATDASDSLIIQVNANDTTFTDKNLEPSTTYAYTVQAVNEAGYSASSNQNVVSTLSFAETKRVKDGLVAYYNFNYDPGYFIHDLSGYGEPLNLKILQPASVNWKVNKKLEILSDVVIASTVPANKIVSAVNKTKEITLECWIKPKEPGLWDDGRVISMGIDDSDIGFVLDQHCTGTLDNKSLKYSVRLQTESTNSLGYPEIIQNKQSKYITMQHIAYVRDSIGNEILYVNGEKTAEGFRPSAFSTWSNNFFLRLGNEQNQNLGWTGTIYSVAIYNNALNLNEVIRNYSAGPCDSLNIQENGLDYQINVFPNPATDKAVIEITPVNIQDFVPMTYIRILDTYGKPYFEDVLFNPNTLYSKTIDLKYYNKGIYFLQIVSGNKQKTNKLIIQ